MSITRLNHAVPYVSDPARSVGFYSNVLGFERVDLTTPGGLPSLITKGRNFLINSAVRCDACHRAEHGVPRGWALSVPLPTGTVMAPYGHNPSRATETPEHCEVSVAKDVLAPGGNAAGAVLVSARR